MKKLIILLAMVLLTLSAFSQTTNYDLDTAIKFYKIKGIIDNAKSPFEDNSWWYTGTAAGGDAMFTSDRYYNTKRIKADLNAKGLDTFLQDENNRIVLAAIANYITDHKKYTFHNDFETLLTIGIDPIEAAVRTSNDNYYLDNALSKGIINYPHCYTHVTIGPFGGHSAAITGRVEIEAKTTEQEVEDIITRLENEKPLVEEFNKEISEFKKQVRKEERREQRELDKKIIKDLAKKIKNGVRNIGDKIQEAGEGMDYKHY